MAFHFFEFCVKQGNLLDEVVVALQRGSSISVHSDPVADVEGMFHENED